MRATHDRHPHADHHTREVLDDAVECLGILRDFPNLPHDHTYDDNPHDDNPNDDNPNDWYSFRHDPALRLYLLASLQQQLDAELLHAARDAHNHGYTTTDIALLLNHAGP